MAGLSLNYATFYNSAIRNLTSLSQTDVVNVLFYGTTVEDCLGTPISTSMGSHLIKGRAQVPKKHRMNVWSCSRDELSDRLRLLEIQNLDGSYQAASRLIQVTGVSDDSIDELAKNCESEDDKYAYIAAVFNLCTKCPKQNVHVLTEKQIELLEQLRERDVPELFEPAEEVSDGEPGEELREEKAPLILDYEFPRDDSLHISVDDLFDDSGVSVRETIVNLPVEQEKYFALFSNDIGFINLDAADVLNIFRLGDDGNHEFRFFCYEGSLAKILKRMPEAFEGRTCDGCLMNYIGSDNMSFMEINEAADILQEHVHPDACIMFGAAFNPEFLDDHTEIWLLCSFVDTTELTNDDVAQVIFGSLNDIKVRPPESSDSLFEERPRDQHGLDPNEAFNDIEKIFRKREQDRY